MTRQRRAVDVAVVGGGIVGTAAAAFLAAAGLTVRLFERTAIAAGASGRNSGIVQHPFDDVLADLYRRSIAEYRALDDVGATGFGLPAEPSGLLYVGRDGALARDEAARWATAWPAARPEVLEGSALVAVEPALAPDLAACRLDIGYPVEPAAATQAFAALARTRSVEMEIGEAVTIAFDRDRATGVRAGGELQPAGRVVVAAGPWSPALVDPSGGWRPIEPIWGVVAAIALGRPPRHGLESIDIDIEPGGAGWPGGDASDDGDSTAEDVAGVDFSLQPAVGSCALGSTFLAHEPVPREWVDRLRRVGTRYVPAVTEAPVLGLRHCARPVSLDGRPLVGEAPWCGDLWIATGNGPWGISTGPGTARVLVDSMLDASGESIAAALAVDRFGAPNAGTQR